MSHTETVQMQACTSEGGVLAKRTIPGTLRSPLSYDQTRDEEDRTGCRFGTQAGPTPW